MKNLIDALKSLKEGLTARPLFLFLDYDGTLAPIADTPSKARISRETKEVLKQLSKTPGCRVAIMSGRTLKDIKKMVSIDGIIYSGNHGLEIEGPKIKFESPAPVRIKNLLKKIKADLSEKLSRIRGVFIEDKGPALGVHYRLVNAQDEYAVKNIVHSVLNPYRLERKVRLKYGKKVFEIRPPMKWDKGHATLWLLARQRFISKEEPLPIYIGDDLTDEDAFRALKDRGITIFVGEGRHLSRARYYLKDSKEVLYFLKQILQLRY